MAAGLGTRAGALPARDLLLPEDGVTVEPDQTPLTEAE